MSVGSNGCPTAASSAVYDRNRISDVIETGRQMKVAMWNCVGVESYRNCYQGPRGVLVDSFWPDLARSLRSPPVSFSFPIRCNQ